jgi:hypothetical protein
MLKLARPWLTERRLVEKPNITARGASAWMTSMAAREGHRCAGLEGERRRGQFVPVQPDEPDADVDAGVAQDDAAGEGVVHRAFHRVVDFVGNFVLAHGLLVGIAGASRQGFHGQGDAGEYFLASHRA